MSAVDSLKNSNPQNFIAQKYLDQVLLETGQELFERQDRIAASSPTDVNAILKTRNYTVSQGKLSLSHSIQERFIDMRPRFKNQKRVQIHNSQIWSQFNLLASKIAYGFTENIRQTIAQRYNIDING